MSIRALFDYFEIFKKNVLFMTTILKHFGLEKIQIHFQNTGNFRLSVELRGMGTADVEFHR